MSIFKEYPYPYCLRIGLAVTSISFVPSSVPILGIIFLSLVFNQNSYLMITKKFPSPFGRLFFIIPTEIYDDAVRTYIQVFPSPFWGLIF